MRKIIQVCSFLSLMIVFSVISANAQKVSRYQVEIPFDFNINENFYQAGSYFVKITKNSGESAILFLEDDKGTRLQTLVARKTGDSFTKEPQLVFDKHKNQRYLAKMVIGETGYLIWSAKPETKTDEKAENFDDKSQTVVAAL